MRKYFFISLFLICASSCQINKKEDRNSTVVSFPMKKELKAKVKELNNPILMSRAMFISGDNLYLYKERDSTLFDIFKIPECTYYCSTGTRGGGPDEFLLLDPRSFRSTENGFEAIEAGTFLLKSIVLDDKRIKVERKEQLLEGREATNGFYYLNNGNYLSFGNINSESEFRFINRLTGKYTEFGSYPEWTKANVEQPFQRFVTYLKNCVVHPDGSKFAVFYARFKRFRIYTAEGELLKDINVTIEPYTAEPVAEFSEQMGYYIGQPIAIGDNIYTLCGNRKEGDLSTSKPLNELQVWDWDGNPVACYHLDHRVSSIAISEKYNKMYAFDSLTDNEIYIYDLSKLH